MTHQQLATKVVHAGHDADRTKGTRTGFSRGLVVSARSDCAFKKLSVNLHPRSFASNIVIKKGRGIGPCEALATLLTGVSGREKVLNSTK